MTAGGRGRGRLPVPVDAVLEGPPLSVAVAWRPMFAADVCGDVFFAGAFDGGALIAAIHGGGHGEEARLAAAAVVDALRVVSAEPLERALPARDGPEEVFIRPGRCLPWNGTARKGDADAAGGATESPNP